MAQFELIWRDQCEATLTIRSGHGERAALEYLIGEKLLLFTSTARTRPEFAAQFPPLLAACARRFSYTAILAYVTELEQRLTEESHRVDADHVSLNSAGISYLTSLRHIADMLRAGHLGTA